MAEGGEKRDPKSHRTPTQIKRMDRGYNARPEIVRRRVMNDQARRKLTEEGLVRKGDGKDVDHKRMLKDGGSNARSNLRVTSRKFNRGWRAREK